MNTNTDYISPLLLLVHAKNAYFQWGQVQLDLFNKYARQQNIPLKILYHWQDVLRQDSRAVVVIGVDKDWLDDSLYHLASHDLHIILLDAFMAEPNDDYSFVCYDQKKAITNSLELLRNHGRHQTALFGVQVADTSDECKAITFARYASASDIYYTKNSIDICFGQFLSHIDQYDSVICTNDIIAVYFLSRCREYSISIPGQLYLIGNSNLWISSHISPSLTTSYSNSDTTVRMTLQLYRNFQEFPSLHTANVSLKPGILERESTECTNSIPNMTNIGRDPYQYSEGLFSSITQTLDPEIQKIRMLDLFLSSSSPETLAILQYLADGSSYQMISDRVFLSVDTVKYHAKKIYRCLHVHSRAELQKLLDQYCLRI